LITLYYEKIHEILKFSSYYYNSLSKEEKIRRITDFLIGRDKSVYFPLSHMVNTVSFIINNSNKFILMMTKGQHKGKPRKGNLSAKNQVNI